MTRFLHSCSVEEGARVRARIRSFDDDYEHGFIEHDQDFVTMSSKKTHVKTFGVEVEQNIGLACCGIKSLG